ncbi:ABC transporter permease [Sanguibacter sp. A247]|uniref:ABC transporter permease n=1 Tax=unclassified Sanguibacter TaxID=2645534 RepID=UPI003FD756B4
MSALLAHAPVPFLRTWNAENRKIVDTRAGAVFLGLIALVVVGMSVLVAGWPGDVPLTFGSLLDGAIASGIAMFAPILAILAVTSEFSQRTLAVTLTLEPRRGRVVASKIAAALTATAALVLVGLVIAAVVLLTAATLRGDTAAWDVDGRTVGAGALILVLSVIQGTAFGLLLRSTPLAVIAYLVVPNLVSLITAFIPAVADAAPWFSFWSATAPLYGTAGITGLEWAQLASATAIWIALPGAIGTWRLLKGDL